MNDDTKQVFFIALACVMVIVAMGHFGAACNASDNAVKQKLGTERTAAYSACVERHQPAECEPVKP